MAMLQQAQLQSVLTRALAAAQALQDWHSSQPLHGDLDPEAFVFATDGRTSLRPPRPDRPLSLQQLRYASPERAGQLAPLGPRSDLYSLGLVLYEWLLGQAAFDSQDPLLLAYQHIAVAPDAPHRCNAGVPQPVSELVMRLLAKSPLARYASARGLADDLQCCLQQLGSQGQLRPFALGRSDRSAQLQRPDRLYGRAEEMATLVQLWQRAAQGTPSLCLLSAEAGMGKSALAQALQPSVQASGGQLASAPFAARAGASAYSAWLALCRSLLQALPADALEQLALGAHLSVLAEALPDMAARLGAPAPAPPLPGLAAQRRLHAALLELLAQLAQGSAPLLLFLDDLQWADAASIALLRDLLQAPRARHMLLLGAYREEAVDAQHPVRLLRSQLHSSQAPLLEMRLAPLNEEEVAALLADGCKHLSPLREPSAQLMRQGLGNPGRSWQLLQHWVLQGQLYFDRQRDGWRWAAWT